MGLAHGPLALRTLFIIGLVAVAAGCSDGGKDASVTPTSVATPSTPGVVPAETSCTDVDIVRCLTGRRVDPANAWTQLAVDLMKRFEAEKGDVEPTHAWAGAAYTYRILDGAWGDRALAHLATMEAHRNPDGGYGLNRAWDAFGDGTENPATQSYTITVGYYALEPVLQAVADGVRPASDAVALLAWLSTVPLAPLEDGRACMAYSNAPADAVESAGCVLNVSAGVVRAAKLAAAQGISVPAAIEEALPALTAHVLENYRPELSGWPYVAGRDAMQDQSHNGYTFYGVLEAAGMREAARTFIAGAASTPGGAIGAALLLPYFCDEASAVLPSMEGWRTEPSTAATLAQVALKAAQISAVCYGRAN